MLTRARHLSLSWDSWIKSTSSHPISSLFINLALSSPMCPGVQTFLFHSSLPREKPMNPLFLKCVAHNAFPTSLILHYCIILTTWERFGRNWDLWCNFRGVGRRLCCLISSDDLSYYEYLWDKWNFKLNSMPAFPQDTSSYRTFRVQRFCSERFVHFSASLTHRSLFIRYLTKQYQ